MKRSLARAFGILLLLVLLSACGAKRPRVFPEKPTSKPEPTMVPEPVAPVKKKPVAIKKKPPVSIPKKISLSDEVNQLLEQRNYRAALTKIHLGAAASQTESSLDNLYLQALQGVLGQAEDLLAKKKFAKAGRNFQLALDCFPRKVELAGKAPISTETIKARVDLCADQLMEAGLLAYRAGDLDSAIIYWEKILSFQPQHEASLKAIHTANLQLTNLKSLEQAQ